MKKAIDRTKAALHRQTATEDIDSDKTEDDEVKQGSENHYRFDANPAACCSDCIGEQ
jgi:hypothetical protein